jgi:hypothetical protein
MMMAGILLRLASDGQSWAWLGCWMNARIRGWFCTAFFSQRRVLIDRKKLSIFSYSA